MAKAHKTKSIPEWRNQLDLAKMATTGKFQKPYEQLTSKEKDDLLKAIAIRLGLVTER